MLIMLSHPRSEEKQVAPDGIVIVAEHEQGRIKPVTYEVISFAKKLQRRTSAGPLSVLLLADEVEMPAQELAERCGLDVTAMRIPAMTSYNGELYLQVLAPFLAALRPAFVCMAHTSQGQDYAPGLAVKLSAACITGVANLVDQAGEIAFARPIYGGKVSAHLQPTLPTAVITVQPGNHKAMGRLENSEGHVTILTPSASNQYSRSQGIKPAEAGTAALDEASVIVAAGRGIGEKENLSIIRQLADLFAKSAVAGSRIVCDMGWLGYPCQVGVTGTTVSPQLYIACGISGAVQHIMGMQGSEFIVAINRDPSAAIFQVADICIVEDLTAFIPEFIRVYNEDNQR
jgi:electron transfer flavoprotein alpha subunit